MANEEELSILLIEDEPDAARLIQHVLEKEGRSKTTVEWASDLASGLDRLSQRGFQAVLLDLNLPDSSGFDTFARVRQKVTNQSVIVLTGDEDEVLALRAVRAGADDYLTKRDVRDRFLAQRIRFAVERNRAKTLESGRPVPNGRILSFLGAKGGSGTTTLVANLAAALARLNKSVIAVEFMPESSSLPVLLNQSPSWDIATLLRGATEAISRDTVASCLVESSAGFRALYGPQRAADYRPITPEQGRAVFGAVRSLAEYILVDIPSAAAPSIEEAMRHSAFVILVVECTRLGLNGALAKMPALRAMVNRPGTMGLVLINKAPSGDPFSAAAEFRKRLACPVVGLVPQAGDLLARVSDDLPVLRFPDLPFSQAIHDLARRLNSGGLPGAEARWDAETAVRV